MVKKRLDDGAHINNRNIDGDTVLHIALQKEYIADTQKNYIAIVSLLLEEGALVNILNNEGKTALQLVDEKQDIILGKAMIGTALKIDPKMQKPNFITRELCNYWDQLIKLNDNEFSPVTMIGATGEAVEVSTGDQKVKNIIKFFSPMAESLDNGQKQVKELSP